MSFYNEQDDDGPSRPTSRDRDEHYTNQSLPASSKSSLQPFGDLKVVTKGGPTVVKQSPLSLETTPDVEKQFELPKQVQPKIYRQLRWEIFSTYKKLFSVVFLGNLIALLVLVGSSGQYGKPPPSNKLVTASAVNLLAAILMRQEHVVNLLFLASSAVPHTAPLWLRRRLAKIYSYGGVHSGCGIAATMWYLLFTAVTTYEFNQSELASAAAIATLVLNYCTIGTLSIILTLAYPTLRAKYHDSFEKSHRFAGWIAVAMLWTQTALNAQLQHETDPHYRSFGRILVSETVFWCLIIITCCIIYPWLRLKKRNVFPEVLSPHAIRLRFDYATIDYCMGIKLTSDPLTETHSFATIPNLITTCDECGSVTHKTEGFSVVISNAGDWTSNIIKNPPTHIYTKGALTYGVLRIATVFKPVLVVATGSGIGPCLSLFQGHPEADVRILWSAASPEKTFGKEIIQAVKKADPRATIWDTKERGRPDIVAMSWNIAKREGCEAAVVISNPKVTKLVVFGLESRGLPAYGPIFDS